MDAQSRRFTQNGIVARYRRRRQRLVQEPQVVLKAHCRTDVEIQVGDRSPSIAPGK